MNFCEYCGSPVVPGSNFCSICGNCLTEPQAPVYTASPGYAPNPHGYSPSPVPAANLKPAKNFALISLILCGAGFLTRLLSLVVLNSLYSYNGFSFSLTVLDDVIALVLMAILPVLSLFFTYAAKRNVAKGLQVGAICVLTIQAVGILIRVMSSVSDMLGFGSLTRILSYVCNVFYYIGGTNLLASLLSLFTNGIFFFFHILYLLSGICYLGATVLSFLSAKKLAKS